MSELALLGGPKTITRPLGKWPLFDDADRKAVANVLDSGNWWMYGNFASRKSQVEQFEEEYARYHKVKRGIAVSHGSMALEVCMRAIGLTPGDEVITTPYTFIATPACVLNANALPVFVEVDPETYNLDPRKIEEAITPRTRAILPVHFAGDIADMDAINAIAKKHKLRVIEDAAQAQGASIEGDRYAGSFGEGAIFSFQMSKNLTAGEGGIILTNSDEFADLAWSLRHYGRNVGGEWYEHERFGWNGRMNEFTGALLRTQLAKLHDQATRRMENVRYFHEQLKDIKGLTPVKGHPKAVRRTFHLIMLRYEAKQWNGLPRAKFLEALKAEGVGAAAGYAFPVFQNALFANIDTNPKTSAYMVGREKPIDYASFTERCPNAVRICKEEAIWFTHPQFLGPREDVDLMVKALHKVRKFSGELAGT